MLLDPLVTSRAPPATWLVRWNDRIVLAVLALVLALGVGQLDGVPGTVPALVVLLILVVPIRRWTKWRTRPWRSGGHGPDPDEALMLVRLDRVRSAPLTRDERPLARRAAWSSLVRRVSGDWTIAFLALLAGGVTVGGRGRVATLVWLVLTVALAGVQVVRSVRASRWRRIVGDPSTPRPERHGSAGSGGRPAW